MKLNDQQAIFPNHAHFYVALGAALASSAGDTVFLPALIKRLQAVDLSDHEFNRLQPLFRNNEELNAFRQRHNRHKINRVDLATFAGNCFLGIDAGSTTTKAAIIDADGALLYSFYGNNTGSPLNSAVNILRDIYACLPASARIANSAVTGYGEGLLKAALQIDVGEVETIAHYTAAHFFDPEVDLILDIGGRT